MLIVFILFILYVTVLVCVWYMCIHVCTGAKDVCVHAHVSVCVCGVYVNVYRGQRWSAGLCYHAPPISWRQPLNFKLVLHSASPSISPDSTHMLYSPGIINMYATMLDFWRMCWGFELSLHGYSASALCCRAVFPSPLVFTLQLVIQPATFHPESLQVFFHLRCSDSSLQRV